MTFNEVKISNRKIAISAIIFSGLMIVILHAALVCMIRNFYNDEGKILTTQILENFYSADGTSKQDFSKIDKFLKNYPAATVNIYDTKAQNVYSSHKEGIIVFKDKSYLDYLTAFFIGRAELSKPINEQNGFSQIIWSSDFGYKQDLSFVRVVEPLIVDKNRVGTIEIMYNFTDRLHMINNTRFFCFMLVVSVIFCYFILIERNFEELEKLVLESKSKTK